MSRKVLSTAELKDKIGELTAELSGLLDSSLGEEQYSIYINIAWDQPVAEQPNTFQRICLVSTPGNNEEPPTLENISELSKSLAADPFLNHVIIYNFTNTLLSNFVPADGATVKTMGKFKHTNSVGGIN